MTPWQVLRACRATRAGLGPRVHHGPAGSVHYYSTAPSADDSRSFCLSREKVDLQQLNRRLASYLQQVQCLEADNQRLERQIQEELDRKCPRELRQLDRHLRTASLLQDQISGCLSAQAQVKLQLLGAELAIFDFNARCEKERERRGCVEAELSDLKLLEEGLKVRTLPELQSVVNDQTQQLMELQMQHQQETQGLLAQVSGSVAVEMQTAESSDLIQQLDDLRRTSVTLLEKNQNECWSNAQMSSMSSSPEVNFDPPAGSEVVQAELEELSTTAASLEEELTQLQALNMVLEASGLEQKDSFVQQLVVLQQRADGLCRDLDSVLQTTAQQAADHQTLLDVKSRLETEIQDYRRLLDGLSRQGVCEVADVRSFCATTSPSAFRRNITANKTTSVQGGNLRMMGVQTFPRGQILVVRKTPVLPPLSETVTTVQSIRVHSKHPKNLSARSINTSNLTGSLHKSENQRTKALPERTGRESMTISATINRQNSPVEDKVHTKDCDQNSSIASTQISQSLDEGAFNSSKPETNTAQGITTLVPDTQSARSAAVQAKPETLTCKQTTTDAGFQCTKTGTNIQTEITKTVLCAEPEVKQGPPFVTHTTTTDPSKETAEELKNETETAILAQMGRTEGFIQAKNQDPAQVLSLSSESPAEAVRDAGEVVVTAPVVSGSHILRSEETQGKVPDERAVVKASKPETNTAQGIAALVPDMQSARSVAVQAKPETLTFKQSTTEAGFQCTKTGTNIQTEITKTVLCAEPEVKQGPHFITDTTTTDPSKETAADVKKETETGASDQINCAEDSIQTKKQDPAQVVSLSLKTCAEADGDAGEVAFTASHILKFEKAQSKVSGELVLIEDKHKESKGKKGEEDVEGTMSKTSNSTPNKVMEDADTGSSITTASSGSPDSNDNLEIKTASTEILKKVEVEMNEGKANNGFHDTNEVKVDPTESDNEIVSLEGQEALLSTTKSKQSVSLTRSGVALSSADIDKILSPSEAPVETEVLMSMTDQLFCPVDPEEYVRSPDSLRSPNDREMFLGQNDSDTCLSPVEPEGCLSPNAEEEDEEVCLNLTEANAHVRPVEKYILSTKEEGQSLSFSRDQALPEEDRNRKMSISVRDGDRSFEGNQGSTGTLNGTNINSRPTIQGIGHQLSSSLGGLEFGDPGRRSTIADKEEQLGFGGLYHKSVRDMRSLTDRSKDTSGIADNKGVQNLGGSPGGRYGSEDQKETSSMDSEVRGKKNSDWMFANKPGNSEIVFVKSASFGSVPVNGGPTKSSVASNSGGSGTASDLAASFGGTAANSSGTVSGNAEAAATAGIQGRFRRGSGDWLVYGGSLGLTSTTLPSAGSEENLARATLPATSRPETGKFGRRGSGEGVVYGRSLGWKSSLDGGTSLPSEGKEESPSMATNPATSPRESGRFGSRGSGEWMVYGGSLGPKNSLPRTGSENSLSVDVLPGTSPPVKRRFGSGEWMVYSGDSLPNTESRESPSVAMQLATSPPGAPRAQKFGSRDSGEWRVYGGSTGRLSSASNTNRVSVSSSYGQVISPPNSYTSSGPRLSSAGSGGRLSSSGVIRRSSSVGSGGRLSSSGSGSKLSSSPGSQRTSRSGRIASSGSGETKPVYSSASGRMSTVRSAGLSGAGGATSSQRAPSPGGRMSVGSGGWLSSSPAGGSRISSPGSGSKLSSAGSSDRVSSQAGGRNSSSSGSGRTNSTGGRVISSSDRPIRSTGSGAGGSKERISVCKMAALSISAAGRERSQDRRRQAQRSQQQQQQQQRQQAAAASPLVQRWLTTGVGVTSAEPDGLDDIMRL